MKTYANYSINELKKLANVTRQKDLIIYAEFARRKKQFHPAIPWEQVKLWGLFSWGTVSHLIKSGEIIAPGYTKANKTIWCKPTPEAYYKHIDPLMQFSIPNLTHLAGWRD